MRRGHILALMLIVLMAITAGGMVFTNRVSVDILDRRSADVRLQTLWLARSALDAGVWGPRVVETPAGEATVLVQPGVSAEVTLAGARAVITVSPPSERYFAPKD